MAFNSPDHLEEKEQNLKSYLPDTSTYCKSTAVKTGYY